MRGRDMCKNRAWGFSFRGLLLDAVDEFVPLITSANTGETFNGRHTIHTFITRVLHCNTALTDLPRVTGETFSGSAFGKARKRLPLAVFQLYRQRRQVEQHLRESKQTMEMDVLKCKTVDGVLKLEVTKSLGVGSAERYRRRDRLQGMILFATAVFRSRVFLRRRVRRSM
jgi:hypothetical protein